MRSRFATTGFSTGLLLFMGGAASAAPALRKQVDQNGDFVLIGNTIGQECDPATPLPVVPAGYAFNAANCGTTGIADSAPDVYWRADAPMVGTAQTSPSIDSTLARSTSVLNLPAGATVTDAFLYWAATLDATQAPSTSVTVERPGASAFTSVITSINLFQAPIPGGGTAYQSVADVTSLVQQKGVGAYRVGGFKAATIANILGQNNFAGWWMVVFYKLPGEPRRNLALFDGFDSVNSAANSVTATLSGFSVPNNAGFQGKLGVIAFEGDAATIGDSLYINGGMPLSDSLNPPNNFFNGTRSLLGAAVSVAGDLPQLKGTPQSMSGIDIDVVDISSRLAPGAMSASIQATTTTAASADAYFLAGFVTSITPIKPDFSTSTKTAADVNGGALLVGDEILYTITVINNGNDASQKTVLSDPLPAGVTYVPGSLQIDSVARTDGVADDQGEYNAGTNTVIARIGLGAGATQGGSLASGASSTVAFRAKVSPGSLGVITNQATISAAGQLGSPTEVTATDSDNATDGSQPTPVVVDQCAKDSDCAPPTPRCDTSQSPKLCVACLADSDCPGNTPTCDIPTKTCICVPSGQEICDGKDNDCNGTVDDGFDTGKACSVGLGICKADGKIVCDGTMAAKCNAIPGEALPAETCDDLDDADCDGNPNNGCPDADGDGLPDELEVKIGTNPNDADSDDDGVPDGQEPNFNQDSDGDGLINALDPDSDNDGLFDGTELGKGCNNPATDPTKHTCIPDADPSTTTDPLKSDTDDGGASDGSEDWNRNGKVDPGETDPTAGHGVDDSTVKDSDGDGLGDELEKQIGSNPNDADSDDDGVPDGQEPNPTVDNDGDGLIDVLDCDSDNDGLFDGTELGKSCDDPATDKTKKHCIPDADPSTTTSPLDRDTDHGGASDGSEDPNLNGKVDPGETDPTKGHGMDDSMVVDSDGDGLGDQLEITLGTDPHDADTDNDGLLDGQEPNPNDDTDGDGKKNGVDPDSDNDGIFDGTEAGKDCSNPATDPKANTCIPDADKGSTTTGPLDPDSDHGGVKDGVEDTNHDGKVEPGERDPNNAADDNTTSSIASSGSGSGNGSSSGSGSGSGSGAGGNGSGGAGGNGGGGAGGEDPNGLVPSGNGILCSAPAGSAENSGLGWLFAPALAALIGWRRRQRR